MGINSSKCVMTNNQQRQFSSLQLFADRVSSSVDIIEHSCTVAKMGVTVSEVSWCANTVNLRLPLVDRLKNARVEHRCFRSGIDSNQQNEVSVFNVLDLRVEEVIRPEVVAKGEVVVLAELIVEAVQGVEEVLEGLDVLHALELADAACDVFALDLVDAGCDDRKYVFPRFFGKISSLSQKRDSQSLPLEAVISLS